MLGRGGTPVFARLHQLLHSGNQAPLLVEDLPDGDDGHAHNGGEGDAPTQHVRPVGEDVVIVGAAFVVDPAEHQDQLKEKDDELGIDSRSALTTTIVGEMNIQAAFQRMRGYG